MELLDKHFSKTKDAMIELENSLKELEESAKYSLLNNDKMSSKVLMLNKAINDKIIEIDSIINTLSGALK